MSLPAFDSVDLAITRARRIVTGEMTYFRHEKEFARALLVLLERQQSEYICKCGLRVIPHRCQQGSDF